MDCDEIVTKNPIVTYTHLFRYLVYPIRQLFLSHEEPVHPSTLVQVTPFPVYPVGQLPHLNLPDPIFVQLTPAKQGEREHGFAIVLAVVVALLQVIPSPSNPVGQLPHLNLPDPIFVQLTPAKQGEREHGFAVVLAVVVALLQVIPFPSNPVGQLPHLNLPDPIFVQLTPAKQGEREHGFESERNQFKSVLIS